MTDVSIPAPTSQHRGSYGIDAPYVPALLLAGAAACAVLAASSGQWLQWLPAILVLGGSGVIYLHTTLRGKFVVWETLADALELGGDEAVLDVGCGRGMVLNTIARRLTRGRATGVDIWSSHDQSGNDIDVTRRNAEIEGVADRVVLETGDMRDVPFADSTFDVIVTNAAVHNLKASKDRAKALAEMWRVTRSGGRFVLADIAHTGEYEKVIRSLGATDVQRRSAGVQGWFGNPFYATRVVTATKP